MIIKNGDYDILIVSEGTYPYIRGGVAHWIQQLISELNEFNFGVVFLGSQKQFYNEVKYDLPPNLTYLYTEFLFDEDKTTEKKPLPEYKEFFEVVKLHHWFETKKNEDPLPEMIKNIKFFQKIASKENFLYSLSSYNYIEKKYFHNAAESPFIDYYWSVKNMHYPLWKVIDTITNIKKPKIVHSPSTGYAGFLAALLKIYYKIPFILTEHGIYIRERKIDLLNAKWLTYNALFNKKLGELSYAKEMWIKFFQGIGKITYEKSNKIISLYNGAKEVQIEYGANPKKCEVIPNGIKLEKFKPLRKNSIPKIITLIGRVVSIKDIKTFIKAIKILTEKHPEVEGWIVGPMDEDKEYANECKILVDNLNLNNNLKFLGFQNILDILPKSGILTLTSISEGMPLTILEGFAAGLPCVATDVGSCKELIYGRSEEDKRLGKAGLITPIANPTKTAKAYEKLLFDEKFYKSAQNAAINRVEKYYLEEYFLEKYKNIYKEYL